MEYAYLAATLGAGALLYRRYPGLYLFYTWWLWFFTPEVRRLIDYVQGWNPTNPVMLAPYLVSALTLFTLVRHLPKLLLNRFFPFILIFLALFYASIVGVYRGGVFNTVYQLIEWLVPVLFAFYLTVHWRIYPTHQRAIQHAFVLAIPVASLYGLIQFFFLPPWDKYWMLSAPLSSIGQPAPLEVRMFGTLNSPIPFASFIMAGLLLFLGRGGLLRWPAAALGYTSFFLSLVRQAWGGWLVGLLFIMVWRRNRISLLITLVLTALVVLPLLTVGPVADRINTRLETLTALSQDNSFRARVEFYKEYMPQAFLNPVGEGLGSTGSSTKLSTGSNNDKQFGELGATASFDSGVMEIPFILGWPGTALYIGGFTWLLYYAFRYRNPEDLVATASCGIVVAILAQLPFVNMMTGWPGMLLWTFVGLVIAAEAHHRSALRSDSSGAMLEGLHGEQSAVPKDVVRESGVGVDRRRTP